MQIRFCEIERSTRAFDALLKSYNIRKSFGRLTFGEYVGLLRFLNGQINKKTLSSKTRKAFGRDLILSKENLAVLDSVSSRRAAFVHYAKPLSDEDIVKVLEQFLEFAEFLRSSKTFPNIIRLSREIDDECGRGYAEAIDENCGKWLVYTGEWLNPDLIDRSSGSLTSFSTLIAVSSSLRSLIPTDTA